MCTRTQEVLFIPAVCRCIIYSRGVQMYYGFLRCTDVLFYCLRCADLVDVIDRDFAYLCSYFYIYLSALFSGAPSHLASALFRLLHRRTVWLVVGLHFELCAPVSLAAADRARWAAMRVRPESC